MFLSILVGLFFSNKNDFPPKSFILSHEAQVACIWSKKNAQTCQRLQCKRVVFYQVLNNAEVTRAYAGQTVD